MRFAGNGKHLVTEDRKTAKLQRPRARALRLFYFCKSFFFNFPLIFLLYDKTIKRTKQKNEGEESPESISEERKGRKAL